MDCPRCGLTNPPSAQRCDCGYSFAGSSGGSGGHVTASAPRQRQNGRVFGFAVLVLISVAALGRSALAVLQSDSTAYGIGGMIGALIWPAIGVAVYVSMSRQSRTAANAILRWFAGIPLILGGLFAHCDDQRSLSPGMIVLLFGAALLLWPTLAKRFTASGRGGDA